MRRTLVAAALAARLSVGGPRAAQAGEAPDYLRTLALIGLGLAAGVQLSLTAIDVTALARDRPLPRVYGGIETAWGLYNVYYLRGWATHADPLLTPWLIWSAALTAHGAWTLLHPRPAYDLAPPTSPRVSLAPLVFEAGAGAVLSGRF